jgi:hypothetical protein
MQEDGKIKKRTLMCKPNCKGVTIEQLERLWAIILDNKD